MRSKAIHNGSRLGGSKFDSQANSSVLHATVNTVFQSIIVINMPRVKLINPFAKHCKCIRKILTTGIPKSLADCCCSSCPWSLSLSKRKASNCFISFSVDDSDWDEGSDSSMMTLLFLWALSKVFWSCKWCKLTFNSSILLYVNHE